MKKRSAVPVLSVALGLAGFVLRLLQNRTGFEPETGLPIAGNLPAVLLPVLLAASAAVFALTVRALPKEPETRSFSAVFACKEPLYLTVIVLGVFLMAASGVWELLGTVLDGDAAPYLTANGLVWMTDRAADTSHRVMGALPLASAVCLFFGAAACRRETVSPLPVLAAPALLLVRLIFAYRLYSVDPVLGSYYVELLSLIFLILGLFRLSGFSAGSGAPRLFSFYTGVAAVLALTLLADGLSGSALLALGGAAYLLGFQLLLTADHPAPDSVSD